MKTSRTFTLWLLGALLALSLLVGAGAAFAQEAEPQGQAAAPGAQTVYDVIAAEPALQSFETLVDAIALRDNLRQDGPFTVFAPSNEAMETLGAMAQEMDATVPEILLYHVVNGRYPAAALDARGLVQSLSGNYLQFESTGAPGALIINGSVQVARADVKASNGVVHIIDELLPFPEGNELLASEKVWPQATVAEVLAADGRFDTFLSLADQAGLMDLLQRTRERYTVFAPTDEAFETLPEGLMDEWLTDPEGALRTIIAYHIVADRLGINQLATADYVPTLEGRALVVTTDQDVTVYLNGRAVQSFNLLAGNDVIHVMGEVILP